jgi:UMF1 family MFS transporter
MEKSTKIIAKGLANSRIEVRPGQRREQFEIIADLHHSMVNEERQPLLANLSRIAWLLNWKAGYFACSVDCLRTESGLGLSHPASLKYVSWYIIKPLFKLVWQGIFLDGGVTVAAVSHTIFPTLSESEYKRRIRAWTMYDWANSAFATTILAAVLPIYYSQEAGATLASPALATAYWSRGLSISLLIVAVLSPILGTISDVMRGKKRFLSIFFGLGVIATGLLVLVDTGDWMLASILFVLGRIGFTAANVFYDALLPHVARPEDVDVVSTRGYAMGYLGGGLLLALNAAMILYIPGTWGSRLSFLSVAIWWAVFSIPIFRVVPEPPAATARLGPGENVISVSFKRLWETLRDIRQYRELFKFVVSFLIYNDGIGTIIGVAAIYGAELGFGSLELVLALLLVQFVGIPYSLIFGRLPSKKETRRPFYLAFVLYNLVALPLVGILGARLLPAEISGSPPEAYHSTAAAAGEGTYDVTDSDLITYVGAWSSREISAVELGSDSPDVYRYTNESGARLDFPFNGQRIRIIYATAPDFGVFTAEMDGVAIVDEDSGEAIMINAYSTGNRYEVGKTYEADTAGEHVLSLVNTGETDPNSSGTTISVTRLEVLPPVRQSNLGMVIGLIVAVELVGLAFAFLLGKALFSSLAEKIDTKRGILLALSIYAVIAIWGFFLNSVIEFWFLAWMVAVVQGGSQALSRSLFSSIAPAAKSGEFFGLFGIMEKFSAILGPLIFAWAAITFGNSRPAVLSLIVFFIVGGYLLTRVNVEAGKRLAQEEDARLLGGMAES